MAYKNQKKNKKKADEKRKKYAGWKAQRKRERRQISHPPHKMSMDEMEAIIKNL